MNPMEPEHLHGVIKGLRSASSSSNKQIRHEGFSDVDFLANEAALESTSSFSLYFSPDELLAYSFSSSSIAVLF